MALAEPASEEDELGAAQGEKKGESEKLLHPAAAPSLSLCDHLHVRAWNARKPCLCARFIPGGATAL